MKILIAGAGGLGCYFGGLLKKNSYHVDFLARGKHLQALKETGLKVKSIHGDFSISPVHAIESLENNNDQYDIIFVASKTTGLDVISSSIKNNLKENGLVLHVQNGLNSFETISRHINSEQVVTGIAYIVSTIESPGVILQKSKVRKLQFGHSDGLKPNDSFKAFAKACRESEIDIEWNDEIKTPLIEKFIFISAFSGLTAYYQCNLGEILNDPNRMKEFEQCIRETTAVTQSLRPEPVDIEKTVTTKIDFSKGLESNLTSSLQSDFRNRKPTELDALTGQVLKLAKAQSIDTPVNNMILKKLRGEESVFKKAT